MNWMNDISWQDVLRDWQQRESGFWDDYLQEKGVDWGTWRSKWIDALDLAHQDWQLYSFEPHEVMQLFTGPFDGWKRMTGSSESMTFEQLTSYSQVHQNPKVQALLKDYPSEVTVMLVKSGDRYVVLDGMHRMAALALLVEKGDVPSASFYAHVAEFDFEG